MAVTAVRHPPAPRPPEPLAVGRLADLARRIAVATPLWRPHVRHEAEARRPVRLLADVDWEAWVIGWTPGQCVELHDHGDAAGALTVAEGRLVDIVLRDSRLRRRSLVRETTLMMLPGLIHDVVSPGPEPATSIHVYSPPLTQMTFYDDAGVSRRTVDVASEPPVLDGGYGSWLAMERRH